MCNDNAEELDQDGAEKCNSNWFNFFYEQSSPPRVQNCPGWMLGHEVKSHFMVLSSKICSPWIPFDAKCSFQFYMFVFGL